MSYPQLIEKKTLGKFVIDPQEVKKHYVERGECKETDMGVVDMSAEFYTFLEPNKFVAHTIEEVPKYVSCGKCGKFLSFTEVDFANIKRMAESARVLYVEDAEKQRKSDEEFNNTTLASQALLEETKQGMYKHIRSDNEIKIDSYSYMHKWIASVLDGLDENARKNIEILKKGLDEKINGHVKICSSCENGTWWALIT